MSFSSLHFLFIFLPSLLILYLLFRRTEYRNAILLLGSLVFFAWADLPHLPVLLLSVLLNYAFGLLIDRSRENGKVDAVKNLTRAGVLLNLGLLFFYKYLNFFAGIWQAGDGTMGELVRVGLPVGISYFTFSGISYLVDVSQSVVPAECNLLKFSNFLVMFPRLLQGPITRIGQVKTALDTMTTSREALAAGVRRFIVGLVKKVLIADTMAIVAERVFQAQAGSYGAGVAWFGLTAYTLQIFFDFAGYTDMALGLGMMLGFHLPENFNYPYIARSISDFWRRWHMTLTAWFRTYVFIPLEFARKKEKFLRQPSNLVIVFLLTGLWHGAGWNFIIWGTYFGLLLALESGAWGRLLKKAPRILQHLYSLALIMLGWGIFRLTNLADWKPFFSALFGEYGWSGTVNLRSLNILMYWPVMLLSAVLSTPLLTIVEQKLVRESAARRFGMDLVYLLAFLLAITFLVSNGYSPFLYTQF